MKAALRKLAKSLLFTSNTIRYAVEGPRIAKALSAVRDIDVLLDAGAGGGEYALTIYAPICRKLILVELDERNFAILRKYLHRIESKCEFHGTSITNLPIPNASVDCVACTQVLEHVPDDEAAIREFARVLKVGGHLLLTTPIPPAPWPEPDHVREGYGRDDLLRLLKKKGFALVAEDFFLTRQTQRIVKGVRKYFRGYAPRLFPLVELSLSREHRRAAAPHGILVLLRKT